ncbi:MaoC family dehydratase [Caldimonas thermodepolymerans]|mgnify:CR=1 FL=1|jgi:acyl dehydratase|uniref:Dehydratase n=1 Tax=Caldimonas thermodepolymerans TaxID=215580 RepID=A0A2S5T463_9BURK|nr:MaoC family dehydratase [Caldimonas thermodepolymerans]PPE69677.1 dehydratase [Caldimonas thermodepolymerans]QPC31913.1 MaoC family dehydratase [Caldimonas thermodepolymerans]RDI01568.1 acyl dehydratase [Caldimonas thermodepolymerans]TCP04984.1 acyl dehydratase [Caldimonas thermodepolymerans]UZG44701.1 MaoC family dehydratase [Caldimonas thermodepolymerans]
MNASSTPTLYWEDFEPGSVTEFGHKLVDRDEVIQFASQFDPQPFHLDDAAAQQSLFGRLAASGWHTCAMVMRMMCDGYLLQAASLGSPGVDNLRWLKPVYPGDVLRVRMTIKAKRPMNSRPHVGLVHSQWEAIARRPDGTEDVVLTMEGWGMFQRREVAPPQPAA